MWRFLPHPTGSYPNRYQSEQRQMKEREEKNSHRPMILIKLDMRTQMKTINFELIFRLPRPGRARCGCRSRAHICMCTRSKEVRCCCRRQLPPHRKIIRVEESLPKKKNRCTFKNHLNEEKKKSNIQMAKEQTHSESHCICTA